MGLLDLSYGDTLLSQIVLGFRNGIGFEMKNGRGKNGISLINAAENIVPVKVAAREQIEQLQREANGRYISAAYPGPYRQPTALPSSGRRLMRVEEG